VNCELAEKHSVNPAIQTNCQVCDWIQLLILAEQIVEFHFLPILVEQILSDYHASLAHVDKPLASV